MFKSIATVLAAITLGSTALVAQANPSSDGRYYNVSDYLTFPEEVKLGDDHDHKPSHTVTFHLPNDYDGTKNVILQMRIRSVNKSQYNAVYVNPDFSRFNGEYCDPVHRDGNEHQRVDYLPYAVHDTWDGHQEWRNVWSTYHKVIPGHRLQPGANELLVCARDSDGNTSHDLDKFYVQDIALHYRILKERGQ